jgi:bifunctional lysine-specific demethylase and histidyl-hydroxylase NO66
VTGLSLDEFGRSYWGVAPLLRRAAQLPVSGSADLLSLAGVDELLSRRGLRTPFVRMSKNGDLLPAARFTRGGGAGAEIADQVADDKVLAEFSAGATLVLQGLHRMWPPIQDFAAALATQLGHPVQVNAYVTPPQNTGFAPHYDTHDVFVLQFAGRKSWRIHEPVWPLPLLNQPWQERKAAVAERSAQAPLIEEVLEPGDALYLPRGFLHAATALGEVSGHLTIGVHPITRRALADQVLATLGADLELRRALPLGTDLANQVAIDAELDATITALHHAIDRCDRAAVARGIGRHLAKATRPVPLRPLEQLSAAQALASDRPVRLRAGLRFATRIEAECFVIELPDKDVRVPASSVEAAQLATSGAVVNAEALPGVDTETGLLLLSQLLREGIVVPA